MKCHMPHAMTSSDRVPPHLHCSIHPHATQRQPTPPKTIECKHPTITQSHSSHRANSRPTRASNPLRPCQASARSHPTSSTALSLYPGRPRRRSTHKPEARRRQAHLAIPRRLRVSMKGLQRRGQSPEPRLPRLALCRQSYRRLQLSSPSPTMCVGTLQLLCFHA